MKRIWKYQLKIDECQTIELPEGFKILSIDIQHGEICLWTLVDDDEFNKEHLDSKQILQNREYYKTGDESWGAYLKESTSDDDKHRNLDYERWLFSRAKSTIRSSTIGIVDKN